MPKLTFVDEKVSIEVTPGTSILQAAMAGRVPLYHTCGGNCSCSTCRVFVMEGSEHLSRPEDEEKQILDAFDLKAPHRLGCQAIIGRGDVTVRIPKRDKAPRPNKTPPLPDET